MPLNTRNIRSRSALCESAAAEPSGRPEEEGGPGTGTSQAGGLCPGDSGGALYREGTNRVVGVNASYTFLPDSNVPVTNWHTRLDGDARWGVASWLESFGAHLTRPCTSATCRPPRSADSDSDGTTDP
jgi:hypothetical protein